MKDKNKNERRVEVKVRRWRRPSMLTCTVGGNIKLKNKKKKILTYAVEALYVDAKAGRRLGLRRLVQRPGRPGPAVMLGALGRGGLGGIVGLGGGGGGGGRSGGRGRGSIVHDGVAIVVGGLLLLLIAGAR